MRTLVTTGVKILTSSRICFTEKTGFKILRCFLCKLPNRWNDWYKVSIDYLN